MTSLPESLHEDAPLLAHIQKPTSQMTEAELRAHVESLRRLRTEPQLMSSLLQEEAKGVKRVRKSAAVNLLDELTASEADTAAVDDIMKGLE